MISGSNEQLQQELEYTLLKPDCHSWGILKMQSEHEDTKQTKQKQIPTKIMIIIIPLKMINEYDRKLLGAKPWATSQSIEPWYKKTHKKVRKSHEKETPEFFHQTYINNIYIYI